MRGFPRNPPAARSDQPEPAWQEPRLPDPESARHFPPAANKNPLSFTSLRLSVRGTCQEGQSTQASGSSQAAHSALGGPTLLRGVAGIGMGGEQRLQGGLGPRCRCGLSPRQRVTPSGG